MTSFRTLVKYHKGLKGTVVFTRRCFTVKLIWKISQNIHSKETVMKSFFFQLSHNLRFTEKEIHHSYFPMTFPRLFIILFCLKMLVKSCKGLKGTEAFAQIWVEKNWSRKFHKIQPKETVMMPFFHISRKLQLKWNFITVIFRCLL